MAYWLMKSEPSVYPWAQLVTEGRTWWDGVRNYQANNFLKTMTIGDEAFFYHSNDQRAIVGIMRITAPWKPDLADEKKTFGMVEVVPVRPLQTPVTLQWIKTQPILAEMALLKQSRLSVSPVTLEAWKKILEETQ